MKLSCFNVFKRNYQYKQSINFGKVVTKIIVGFLILNLMTITIGANNKAYASTKTKRNYINHSGVCKSKTTTFYIPSGSKVKYVKFMVNEFNSSLFKLFADGDEIFCKSWTDYNNLSRTVSTNKTVSGDSFSVTVWSSSDYGLDLYTSNESYVEITYEEKEVDKDPPSISIYGVSNGSTYTSPVRPSFSASDPSGVSSTSATLNGSYFSSGSLISTSGSKTLRVTARDKEGNTGTRTVWFTMDLNDDPTVSLTTNDNQLLSEKAGYNQYIISGDSRDVDTGDNVTVKYNIKNQSNNPLANHNNQIVSSYSSSGLNKLFNKTINIDNSFGEGNYELELWAEDNNGGKSSISTRNFKVDKTGPNINISGVSEGTMYQNSATPIFSANDTSGISNVSSTLNGESFITSTSIKTGGNKTLLVNATDNVGNTSQKNVNFYVNLKPQLNLLKPTENEYFSNKKTHNTISIQGTVQDNDAGDNLTVYYTVLDKSKNPVPGYENVSIGSLLADGNIQSFDNYEITVDDSLPEGDHTINIWCEDDKYGKSNVIIKNIKVDKSGPTVNIPTVNSISDTEISITPNANDPSNLNAVPFLYNREDSDITSWIDTNPYVDSGLTANTQYTYKYKAKDSLDNESEYSTVAKIFTKAIDSENILITDSGGTSLTFQITNAPQGQPPEHKLELKVKGAGMDGVDISTSDWSADTSRELTGLLIETEYELWITTRNGDGVENPKHMVIDSFITNTAPKVSVSAIEEQRDIDYDNSFTLEGNITDKDLDIVTIEGVLGGIRKTTSIDTSVNSKWSLTWTGTELNTGQFDGITITANDGKSGTDNTKWNGSIVINPYVELNGDKLIEIERESGFIDPGATSNYKVKVLGSVDTSKLGEYILTYEAENLLGKKASKTRTVVVIKNLKDRIRDKITEINEKLDDLKNTNEIDLPTDLDDLNKAIDELEDQINSLPDGKEKDDFTKELEEIKEERDKILEKVSNKAYFEDQINKIHIDFDNDPVILVLPNLDKGEYRFSVIDLEDNTTVIPNTISTGGSIEIPGAKMGHTYRVIVEIYYNNTLYSRTVFDSTYPDTIAPVITGIYRLNGEVYVLGSDNYKLAIKPYGFMFKEDSYVEKELTRSDGKPLQIKAVGRMYLDSDDTKYYKDNHIAINAPNILKVLLKDRFDNICEKEITVNDKNEIIYGEVPDEIRDAIYGDKSKDKNDSEDKDIVITDPNIDEELKDDIVDTINDTDVKSDDTEINSNEGKISVYISNKLKNKYIGADYRYRLDVIKKDNMKLVYTKILDEPENVEIPKLQDSTTYIVRISILKGNKELAFKEVEQMTKDRTAPIIESIVVRNNRIDVIAKDNLKLHSKAYKFDITGKSPTVVKDGISVGEGVMVASIDSSLDITLVASNVKWTEGNWQSGNKKEIDSGTKLIVSVRDKEGNWTQSNEIVADRNGIIHETINPDNPLVVNKGSKIDIEEIIKKIIDKLGKDFKTEDLDIKITQGAATIQDGKINVIGKGNIIVSITNLASNRTMQYLIKAVDNKDSFKRRIIVEKGSQSNIKLAFNQSLKDIFEDSEGITFETTSSNIGINDYVLRAIDNGIGTITASDEGKSIKLYVIVADCISDVRSNIEKIDDNVAYTILKGKEVNIKDYLELEGKNVDNKYLITETDSKNINFLDNFRFKAIDEGVTSIRVIDLAQGKIRNISFKIVDIKPSEKKPTDIQNHWANKTIEKSISKGIIDGYDNDTFRPNKTVTTKEFLVMLNNVKLLTDKEDKKLNSIKLNKADWSYYEAANATMGIKEDELDFLNNDEWDRALTREKAVYLISKILDIKSAFEANFIDIENCNYKDSIKAISSILEGYEDGSFKGDITITRAEALTLISRILQECAK